MSCAIQYNFAFHSAIVDSTPILDHMVSSTPTVLLADDSLSDLRLLIEMLVSKRFRIVAAFDGHDAYRKAVLNRPNLILLDIHMPGVDGIAACRLLKTNPVTHDIPVIFLTAANEPEQQLMGLSLGAVDYVTKPFSEEIVLARVGLHLDIARRLAAPSTADSQTHDMPESPASVLVRAATDLLAKRLGQAPSPAELAKLLGTNETRLNEAFRRELGQPVFAYVREERMRQARQLLANTDIPVASIGAHLGYANPSNFATAFRTRFGASPREFRLSLQESS